jgi:hypothetical protein
VVICVALYLIQWHVVLNPQRLMLEGLLGNQCLLFIRHDVLTVVNISMLIFWVVTRVSLRRNVPEHARTPFRKLFLKRTQTGTGFWNPVFPGVGITNTTCLRPNFGSLFVFQKLFQKKMALVATLYGLVDRYKCFGQTHCLQLHG